MGKVGTSVSIQEEGRDGRQWLLNSGSNWSEAE